eukprot:3932626-Rhodomonas_salina.1
MLLANGITPAGVAGGSFTNHPHTVLSCSVRYEFILMETSAAGHTSRSRCSVAYACPPHTRKHTHTLSSAGQWVKANNRVGTLAQQGTCLGRARQQRLLCAVDDLIVNAAASHVGNEKPGAPENHNQGAVPHARF